MKPKALKTIQYHGGKSGANPAGKWVASMLPWEYETTYVEPFAGMLGVLTQRRPTVNEVVNDINGDIANWWIQVRDNHEELTRLVALTPRSRQIFKQAWKDLKENRNELSPVRRALATNIIIMQSIMHGADCKQWAPTYTPHRLSAWVKGEIGLLANRLRHVYIESRDALEVLERVGAEKDAVVYCDPPYRTTDLRPYGKGTDGTDWELMEKILKRQKGRVAISGYGEEWDCLGWHRHEFKKQHTVLMAKGVRETQDRTEVLWCNYKVEANCAQKTLEL